eukprot:jgi/Chrzof1/5618/Cz16g09050.t1
MVKATWNHDVQQQQQRQRCTQLHRPISMPVRQRNVIVLSKQDDDFDSRTAEQRQRQDELIVTAATVVLTTVAMAALTVWREPLQDIIYGDGLNASSGPGAGDVAAGALWSVAYWFASPLQLLLLFLGKIDTERPSDWIINIIGRAAKLRVKDVDYVAPVWVQASAASICIAGGIVTAAVLDLSLGDSIWALSSGIGACIAAAVYEVGRPRRLSREEAVTLEAQWQDFAGFADKRLQRGGRCHESEIFSAFRRDFARYRSAEALPDTVLRDMVRNWYPDVERTRTGYYKNVSLRAYVDAFTGQQAGFTASTPGLNGNSTTTGSSALDNTSSVSSSLEASSAMYSSRTGKGGSGLVNSTLEE